MSGSAGAPEAREGGPMSRRQIVVVGAMIEQDGKYLITQRSPRASLPLLWEFPGGRMEEGETDRAALARELREEMGIEVEVGGQAMHVKHAYAEYDIDFRVFKCRLTGGNHQHPPGPGPRSVAA